MSAQPDSDQRERLSRALIALCFERGYHHLNLATLLDCANVDQAAFECHFADLEDCFCKIYEKCRDEYLTRLGAAFVTQQGWRNQLRVTAYASLAFLREDLPRARFLFIEVLTAGTRAQLVRDQGMDALTELIDLGRCELDDPDSVSRDTAVAIAGGIYDSARLAVDRDDPHLWEALVPQLMYTAVLPYFGPDLALEELATSPPEDRAGAQDSNKPRGS